MNPLIKLRIPFLGLAVLSMLGLSACSNKTPQIMPYNMMEMNTRLSPEQQKALLNLIRQSGVQVIQQGSRLIMVLPTDIFFVPTTTIIRENKTPKLRMIALYLHNYTRAQYTTYPIKIYGYTDQVYQRHMRQHYSRQYAQVIASFMWRHGFRPQQMSVVGHGAKYPIANNKTIDGSAYNRRVVIRVN